MSKKLIVGNQRELPYAVEEALNRLRINMSFLGSDIKTILIISTDPNEGKSFVATQIWRQMCEAGNLSVLVDADLRNSRMIRDYDLHLEKGKGKKEKIYGTSSFLAGSGSVEDAIYETNIENGYILPNADNVINPSMLIESNRFEEMLTALAEKFRYVFVDCPPLGLVSDGEQIAHRCDGAILVVRSGVTGKKRVRTSMAQLERAGCPLLGVVMNRAGGTKNSYYSHYGQYGAYYGKYYGSGKGDKES